MKTAPQISAYFLEAGVDLRVIRATLIASPLAERAGVPRADGWVDATALHTGQILLQLLRSTYLVASRQNRSVDIIAPKMRTPFAMTGDGVNDIWHWAVGLLFYLLLLDCCS